MFEAIAGTRENMSMPAKAAALRRTGHFDVRARRPRRRAGIGSGRWVGTWSGTWFRTGKTGETAQSQTMIVSRDVPDCRIIFVR